MRKASTIQVFAIQLLLQGLQQREKNGNGVFYLTCGGCATFQTGILVNQTLLKGWGFSERQPGQILFGKVKKTKKKQDVHVCKNPARRRGPRI